MDKVTRTVAAARYEDAAHAGEEAQHPVGRVATVHLHPRRDRPATAGAGNKLGAGRPHGRQRPGRGGRRRRARARVDGGGRGLTGHQEEGKGEGRGQGWGGGTRRRAESRTSEEQLVQADRCTRGAKGWAWRSCRRQLGRQRETGFKSGWRPPSRVSLGRNGRRTASARIPIRTQISLGSLARRDRRATPTHTLRALRWQSPAHNIVLGTPMLGSICPARITLRTQSQSYAATQRQAPTSSASNAVVTRMTKISVPRGSNTAVRLYSISGDCIHPAQAHGRKGGEAVRRAGGRACCCRTGVNRDCDGVGSDASRGSKRCPAAPPHAKG